VLVYGGPEVTTVWRYINSIIIITIIIIIIGGGGGGDGSGGDLTGVMDEFILCNFGGLTKLAEG